MKNDLEFEEEIISAQFYCKQGQDFLKENQNDSALLAFTNAIEVDEKYAQAYFFKGIALFNLNSYEEAINAFNDAIKINPKFSEAYYNKGIVLHHTNNKQHALSVIETALQINPQDHEILAKRDSILKELGISIQEKYEEIIYDQQDLRNELQQLKKQVQEHNLILDKSGSYEKAQIKIALENLRNENLDLYNYCITFHHTMKNMFDAYRLLGTGLMAPNVDNFEGANYKVARKGICTINNITQIGLPALGPLFCATHEMIGDVYDLIMGRKFDNKAECIKKIIEANFKDKDLTIELGKFSLSMTDAKKEEILNPKQIEKPGWVREQISFLTSRALGPSPIENNHINELVLKHSAYCLGFLCENNEWITKSGLPFNQHMSAIASGANLDNLLKSSMQEKLLQIETIRHTIAPADMLKIENSTLEERFDKTLIYGGLKVRRGISNFFDEEYISAMPGNPMLARMAIFDQMCKTVITQKKGLMCLKQVSEKYVNMIDYIAKYCPLLFGSPEIAAICIENENMRNEVIKKLVEAGGLSSNQQLLLEDKKNEDDGGYVSDEERGINTGFYLVPKLGATVEEII